MKKILCLFTKHEKVTHVSHDLTLQVTICGRCRKLFKMVRYLDKFKPGEGKEI